MSRARVSHDYVALCAEGVAWYRKHGRYPDRVTTDREGVEYVVGDWSWNRLHPSRGEWIEPRMEFGQRARVAAAGRKS